MMLNIAGHKANEKTKPQWAMTIHPIKWLWSKRPTIASVGKDVE